MSQEGETQQPEKPSEPEKKVKCATCGTEVKESMAVCLLCAGERSGLTKLEVKDGDVVILKCSTPPPPQMVQQLGHLLHALGKKCGLFVMPMSMVVDQLDEETMKKAGWVRATGKLILPTSQNVKKLGSGLIKP